MATRSTIAIEFADQSVSQIYCHFDGYLSNNGQILAAHYMDPFKVRELVDLGGFSSLRKTVEETAEGAYTQRGEDKDVNRYQNVDEYFEDCQQEEYDYILRNVNNTAIWFVRCYATNGVWVDLQEAGFLEARMSEEECY
jgi:hypothetical protein